jgi:hypothetical protein
MCVKQTSAIVGGMHSWLGRPRKESVSQLSENQELREPGEPWVAFAWSWQQVVFNSIQFLKPLWNTHVANLPPQMVSSWITS